MDRNKVAQERMRRLNEARQQKKYEKVRQQASEQQESGEMNLDNAIVLTLQDPMSIYAPPTIPETVGQLLDSADFLRFQDTAFANWGVTRADLKPEVSLMPPVSSPSTTTIAQWTAAARSSGQLVPVPTVAFYFRQKDKDREHLVQVKSDLDAEVVQCRKELQESNESLEKCRRSQNILQEKLSASGFGNVQMDSGLLAAKVEEMLKDSATFKKTIEDYQKKLDERDKLLDERDKLLDERDQENAEYRMRLDKRDELIHELRMGQTPAMRTFRKVCTRQLLEAYLQFLRVTYPSVHPASEVNAFLQSLLRSPTTDKQDRHLIPLVTSDSGSLYGIISATVVLRQSQTGTTAADLARIEMAAAVSNTPENEHRKDLIDMYQRMFGRDPVNETFGSAE